MAQLTAVSMTDDLGGGKAAETISFALDGTAYEINLNRRNAKAMRKTILAYAKAGRPAGTVLELRAPAPEPAAEDGQLDEPVADLPDGSQAIPPAKQRRRKTAATAKFARTAKSNTVSKAKAGGRTKPDQAPSDAQIREWAEAQGIEVSPRGRIATAVRDQYLADATS